MPPLDLAPLALMLAGQALADYPLQGDWLSRAKNSWPAPVPDERVWPGGLACHAGIHAGAVWLATGSWLLAGAELLTHAGIDLAKCAGRLTYNGDQALHVACKLAWWAALAAGGGALP